MSARRSKRTNKKRDTEVRDMPARESETTVPVQLKPMPQSPGEVVAETDRTNEQENKEVTMNSWKDRLADWVSSKGPWTHIALAVGIALAITGIILAIVIPGANAELNARLHDVAENITAVAVQARADANQAMVTASGLQATVSGHSTIIGELGNNLNDADTRLNNAEATIADLAGALAELTGSPPEAYLTGTFGNYTLVAKSSASGNFTANVHLLYLPPVALGNTTYVDALQSFYDAINWIAANATAYVPTLAYNGMGWLVTEVYFNIGLFTLPAATETPIDIIVSGLNSTYKATAAYAEVFPVLKETE